MRSVSLGSLSNSREGGCVLTSWSHQTSSQPLTFTGRLAGPSGDIISQPPEPSPIPLCGPLGLPNLFSTHRQSTLLKTCISSREPREGLLGPPTQLEIHVFTRAYKPTWHPTSLTSRSPHASGSHEPAFLRVSNTARVCDVSEQINRCMDVSPFKFLSMNI